MAGVVRTPGDRAQIILGTERLVRSVQPSQQDGFRIEVDCVSELVCDQDAVELPDSRTTQLVADDNVGFRRRLEQQTR